MTATRRSDIVRQRRLEGTRTTPRPKTSRKKRKAERPMPQMVSRGGMVYTPPQTARHKTPRKRLNMALPATGAEVRLPAIPAVHFGWRIASGLLAGLLIYCIFTLWTAPQFTVMNVIVEGAERVDQGDLIARMSVLTDPVFNIDPHGMEAYLLGKFSALEDVSIQVKYPAEVTVTVVERKPVIAWEQAGYTYWWIDENGMAFERLGSSEGLVYVEAYAPPPTIISLDEEEEEGTEEEGTLEEGLEEDPGPQQLLTPEMVKAILFLHENMPEGFKIIYDGEHGLGWKNIENGQRVYFGNKFDNMPVRLALYNAIVEELISKKRSAVIISVEYIHAPYYRMKD
jgi:hypothetical protein